MKARLHMMELDLQVAEPVFQNRKSVCCTAGKQARKTSVVIRMSYRRSLRRKSRMAHFTVVPTPCGKGAASAHRHGLSSPCTTDKERACPLTQPNRAPVGCRQGALPLWIPASGFRARHHDRGDFIPPRPPDPKRSASGLPTRATGAPTALPRWTGTRRGLSPSRLPASGLSHPDTHADRLAVQSRATFRRCTPSRRTPPAPRFIGVVSSAGAP
jgi:hypothetical protein